MNTHIGPNSVVGAPGAAIASAVEAYEAARERDPTAVFDLQPFALPRSHPDHVAAIVELVRVDMEHTWCPDDASRLEHYIAIFPHALCDRDALEAIAYEEFRLRINSGEPVDAEEYRRKYGCDVRDWDAPRSVMAGSRRADSCAEAPRGDERLPSVGEMIWGFELIDILGEGACGRVYLARQTGLASRLVALKITHGAAHEPQQLAQLQHTNIVPIYSWHRRGELCGVCMPFLGRTTVAHFLADIRRQGSPTSGLHFATTICVQHDATRSQPPKMIQSAPTTDSDCRTNNLSWEHVARRPYVDSVVWIATRLADGLAHAHQRGIVHRDLKPANVLLGDDGQPLILDFHLATAAQSRDSHVVVVGGTLPYLAPECIAAMCGQGECLDPRSDLYSLGAMLYELLSGELPYPARSGPLELVAPAMLADRQQKPTSLRLRNSAVSPGLAAIVARCLEYAPEKRYASAQALQEDLQRHLDHRPLRHARDRSLLERVRKWSRRNPRLSSATTIGLIAAALLITLAVSWVIRGNQLAAGRAEDRFQVFRRELEHSAAILDIPGVDDRSLNAAVSRAEDALGQYAVATDPDWADRDAVAWLVDHDREVLSREVASLLYLLAAGRGQQAMRCADSAQRQRLFGAALRANRQAQQTLAHRGVPLAFSLQQTRLLAAAQGECVAQEIVATSLRVTTFEDRYLLAVELAHRRQYEKAADWLVELVRERPHDAKLWLGLGVCSYELARYADAKGYFSTCIALRPHLILALVYRAASRLQLAEYSEALADCDLALGFDPLLPAAYFNRALAQEGLGRLSSAIADLTRALDLGSTETRIYFLRSQWKGLLGDNLGAEADLNAGLRASPRDELGFIARGIAILPRDPAAALADFEAALQLHPASRSALQNVSVVYGEHLSQPDKAVQALDRLIELAPRDSSAVASRGVYYARMGKRDAALRDAEAALRIDHEPMTHYRVGCILSLTSRIAPPDAPRAITALSLAMQQSPTLSTLAAADFDFEPIRQDVRFQSLLAAAEHLQSAGRRQPALNPE